MAWRVLEPGRELQWNWSVQLICRFLEAFARREFHRGIINIPPRGMKSTLVSVCYQVWVWIQPPKKHRFLGPYHQFLCLSNADDLVLRDASKARDLIESEWFKSHWGDRVHLMQDQTEKKFYRNNWNGHRNSKSITGRLTGKGGDTILIDDPHDAEGAMSDAERAQVIEAYGGKVTSRLNDQVNGGIMLIMQRLHEADLAGYVIDKDGLYSADDNPRGWMKLCLPMEYELDEKDKTPVNPAGKYGFRDMRTEPNELLWKDRFPFDVVRKLESDLTEYKAAGQLQQRPSPRGGGILKKSWWKIWPDDKQLPLCDHVFCSWDTAYTEKDMETGSYSVRTVWGVFWDEPAQQYALILSGSWWDRVGYPELRKKAQEDTLALKPDAHLIEKKASGQSLIQDLRRAGKGARRLRIRTYSPDRDKIARAHAASNTFSAGLIYAPNKAWAHQVIDHCATFPAGAPPCSDITDTVTQAVVYLTHRWWVTHPDDVEDDVPTVPDWYEDEDEPTMQRGVYG